MKRDLENGKPFTLEIPLVLVWKAIIWGLKKAQEFIFHYEHWRNRKKKQHGCKRNRREASDV